MNQIKSTQKRRSRGTLSVILLKILYNRNIILLSRFSQYTAWITAKTTSAKTISAMIILNKMINKLMTVPPYQPLESSKSNKDSSSGFSFITENIKSLNCFLISLRGIARGSIRSCEIHTKGIFLSFAISWIMPVIDLLPLQVISS